MSLERWSIKPTVMPYEDQIHPKPTRYFVRCTERMTDWISVLAPSFLDPVSEAGVEVINLHPALPGVSRATLVAFSTPGNDMV